MNTHQLFLRIIQNTPHELREAYQNLAGFCGLLFKDEGIDCIKAIKNKVWVHLQPQYSVFGFGLLLFSNGEFS